MATKDKNGKLTYQMTSPGQAWMDYVNSKEGHNAAAVTPVYLEPQQNKRPDIEKRITEMEKNVVKKNIEVDKAIGKHIEHDL